MQKDLDDYSENTSSIVFSRQVIEFITVTKEFVQLLEECSSFDKDTFISHSHKILALLYLKTTMLPKFDSEFENFSDNSVTELDWVNLNNELLLLIGDDDDYYDTFDISQESYEPVHSSISENLTDIYQDLKNCIEIYKIGTSETSNEALYECQQNFETIWGQKLVSALKELHSIKYKTDNF